MPLPSKLMRHARQGKESAGADAARPRVGFHAPIAGGLQNALLKAQALGADAVQIFSRNPRGWKARPLEEEEVEGFKRVRRETGVTPLVVHANYLINLAAADAGVREKSVASFREEVERGLQLGADYLVVHPGSARGACESDAIRTCSESLNAACEGLSLEGFRILLENTAGQGECIGYRFEHLREIAARCHGLHLGVCLDTAHAFTAGYDIRSPEGLAAGLACNFSVGNVNNGNVAATNTNADNTGGASNSGNASASNTSGEAGGVRVEELHVAKDKDGDEVKTFSPSDRTVYAVATLSEL